MKFKSINYKELWNNLGGLPAQHKQWAYDRFKKADDISTINGT